MKNIKIIKKASKISEISKLLKNPGKQGRSYVINTQNRTCLLILKTKTRNKRNIEQAKKKKEAKYISKITEEHNN